MKVLLDGLNNSYEKEYLYSSKISLSKRDRCFTSHNTSNGVQTKWYADGYFYKLDLYGYQSLAERLSYVLLCHTNINPSLIVPYNTCLISEDSGIYRKGCYSKDFLNGKELYSFRKIFQYYKIPLTISYYDVLDFMMEELNLDIKEYLDCILCLDAITRNDDRHFGNLALIKGDNGFEYSPIFDNGSSFMSDLISYPIENPFELNYSSIYSKPFSVRFENQLIDCNPISIDYESLLESVKRVHSECGKRAVECLLKSLDELKGATWKCI